MGIRGARARREERADILIAHATNPDPYTSTANLAPSCPRCNRPRRYLRTRKEIKRSFKHGPKDDYTIEPRAGVGDPGDYVVRRRGPDTLHSVALCDTCGAVELLPIAG